jgi:thiamine biosynthesis lipoprotein
MSGGRWVPRVRFSVVGWVLLVGIVLAGVILAVRALRPPTVTVSDFAFGTYVRLTVTGPGAPAAARAALGRMKAIEALLDPTRLESDVSRLAAAAGQPEPIPVAPETLVILAHAARAHELSSGAFDASIGPLVRLWGFGPQSPSVVGTPADARRSSPPDAAAIANAGALAGWNDVRWSGAADATASAGGGGAGAADPGIGEAALLRPGMSLTLGGLGKGYAIDEAASILREAGIRRALIDVGGELYLLGTKSGGEVWRIGVQHPREDGYLGSLSLAGDIAVATSGDYQRFFDYEGQRFHHLIDPATGWPADRCRSVTVVATTGVEADYLSTALFVLGPEAGRRLAESLPSVEAVFVDAAGQVTFTDGLEGVFTLKTGEGGDG